MDRRDRPGRLAIPADIGAKGCAADGEGGEAHDLTQRR
jgi:hypothetical protein